MKINLFRTKIPHFDYSNSCAAYHLPDNNHYAYNNNYNYDYDYDNDYDNDNDYNFNFERLYTNFVWNKVSSSHKR